MPTIGQNFTIKWNEEREEQYQEYKKAARKLGKNRSTAVDNLMKALEVATDEFKELKRERDRISKEVEKK